MPAEGVHLTALREASFLGALPTPARRCLLRFEPAARLGAIGPDLPYYDRYEEELARYVLELPARPSPWGTRIHEGGAIDLLRATLDVARATRSEAVAALALGIASHAAIDRMLHPLVNALARRFAFGASQDAAHREAEKFQSILFHDAYLGCDIMGTPAVARLVDVPARELLRHAEVGSALISAYGQTVGHARPHRPLARMTRGYEVHRRVLRHRRVLSSPLGKLAASARAREEARPRFMSGGWGTFDRVLARAIARSVPALERTWAVFDAAEGELDAAHRALDIVLGPGTIEGLGLDVDLEQPFEP